MSKAIENLEKALHLIQTKFNGEEIHSFGPKSDVIIKKTEEILDVSLPDSYKRFIKEIGLGGAGSIIVSGIRVNDENELTNTGLVWKIIMMRKEEHWPKHIISLLDVGDGSYYALDLSQTTVENECPVVIWPIWGYEYTSKLEIVAPDFGTWFLEEIKNEIKEQSKSNV